MNEITFSFTRMRGGDPGVNFTGLYGGTFYPHARG